MTGGDVGGPPSHGPDPADDEVVKRLRDGDEDAFRRVVRDWSPGMLRLARTFVDSVASAEDAVQDAWLGVVRGLDAFEGRSSLRSWVFTILVNRARSRGMQEARTVARSPLGAESGSAGPTVDPARFQGPDDAHPGRWTSVGAPRAWESRPEHRFLADEALRQVVEALGLLPARQRAVVALRDVDGLTAAETCAVLGLTPQNQRVLLHRGRAAVRGRVEAYFRGDGTVPAT